MGVSRLYARCSSVVQMWVQSDQGRTMWLVAADCAAVGGMRSYAYRPNTVQRTKALDCVGEQKR